MNTFRRTLSLSAAALLASAGSILAQTTLLAPNCRVIAEQKISDTAGGLVRGLTDSEFFGLGVGSAGDLNGDGRNEIVVCGPADDDGGVDRGAIWVLFMNSDGTVQSEQKISDTAGGFGAILGDTDQFGRSVAAMGDLDGDTIPDLAIGAYRLDDGEIDSGGVFILLMNSNGTVKSHVRITNLFGGFGGSIEAEDLFGLAVTRLDDLDGDGVDDLAVGALQDDGAGGANRGAVWVLLMNSNGTVKTEVEIGDGQGGFGGTLDDEDKFGSSVAGLGDLDGDGVCDLAVGATGDDDGGSARGAIWVLFLNNDGTVKSHTKISDTQGGFVGILGNEDNFGHSLAALGDIDGNGRVNLAVGVWRDDDGGAERGGIWVLNLNSNGTVASHSKISQTKGGFGGSLDDGDGLGVAVGSVGDLNGDGTCDLIAGAFGDDDGGLNRGAAWIMFLDVGRRMSAVHGGVITSSLHEGSGVNPIGLHEITPAVVGETWRGLVASPQPSLTYLVIGAGGVLDVGPMLGGGLIGELLLRPPYTVSIGWGEHEIAVPQDPSLLGTAFAVQGGFFDQKLQGVQLTNALGVWIGSASAGIHGLER